MDGWPTMVVKNTLNQSERGIATIETVTLLFVFVLFMSFTVGFFGVVHTGILNSISARAYTFETFRNRVNLSFLRDEKIPAPDDYYGNIGFRVNGISESESIHWVPSKRSISATYDLKDLKISDHNDQNLQITKRETKSFNPVWIKTAYGICLNAKCGG